VKVNKISLKQMGGQAQNQNVDPQIQQITEFISGSLEEGNDPIDIVKGLVEQEVDQQIIAQAFMTVGYKEEDVITLFEQVQAQVEPSTPASNEEQTKDPQEIARNQALETEAQEEEVQQDQAMIEQQDAMSQTLMGKSGIEIKPENKGKFTEWAKSRGMTVPGAYNKVMDNTNGYSPSVVKMANFAKNAASWQKQEGGEFESHVMYKGDASQEANSYQQHLNLKELGYINKAQTGKEISEEQKFYDTTGVVKRKDKFTRSPNYINPVAFETNDNFNIGQVANLLVDGYDTFLGGKENKNGIKEGTFRDWNKKKDIQQENKSNYYNYNIKVDENDPNIYGFDNTDLYNASKQFNQEGLDTLHTFTGEEQSMIPTGDNGQPTQGMFSKPKSVSGPRVYGDTFETWYKKNAVSNLGKSKTEMEQIYNSIDETEFKHGGSLPKAQFNLPDEMFGSLTQNQLSNPQAFSDMIANGMNTPDYNKGSQIAADGILQNLQPALGPTPYEQQMANATQIEATGIPMNTATNDVIDGQEWTDPEVTRTNKFEGGLNRFMDSQEVKAFGDVSDFAIAGAGIVNNWFEDKAIDDAQIYNRESLMADNMYGVNEDPFMKRGAWDVNTGTFGSEGQRTIRTNMGTAQRGKEIGSGTIDIDSTLLAKLIAAGADIEIL
jgi:hypothetical protein